MRCRMLLLTMLITFTAAEAQGPAYDNKEPARICNHGGYDVWDVLRMLPVRFIGFEGETLRWKFQDEYTVKMGSFALLDDSRYVSREKKEVSASYVMRRTDSYWLCYYCNNCNGLLRAYELKPGSWRF